MRMTKKAWQVLEALADGARISVGLDPMAGRLSATVWPGGSLYVALTARTDTPVDEKTLLTLLRYGYIGPEFAIEPRDIEWPGDGVPRYRLQGSTAPTITATGRRAVRERER